MRAAVSSLLVRTLPALLIAGALAGGARAQTFEADYDIARPAVSPHLRVSPSVQLSPEFSGAGLSIQGSGNWFGQVGMARQPSLSLSPAGQVDVLNVGGGYRFSNGQSLSLQLSRGRGPGQRLGLAVNYDWPSYFVRFSWDQGQTAVPQDNLRFSAGWRF